MFPFLKKFICVYVSHLPFYADTDTPDVMIPKQQIEKREQIMYYENWVWNLLDHIYIIRTLTWSRVYFHIAPKAL